ncbi:MAG: ABC transporter ATP-binding protein [Actinomycetota bacterium]
MTTRSKTPVIRLVLTLIRNQRTRFVVSLMLWMVIWAMMILVGIIAAEFFDHLTGVGAGWNLSTIIAVLWGYLLARIVIVFGGMRLHSGLLFRAGAAMRESMLSWVFSLPGARPVDETPGEVVSRFRDDVDHTLEAMDFTVDFFGSTVTAIISVVLLFTIDPVITIVVFAPVAIVILVVSRTGSTIRRYRTAARESTEAITGFLGETLGSVQSVKVAGAEATMLGHFEELNTERRKMMVRDRTFTAGLEAVFHNTVSIGTGLILILAAGTLTATGSAGLTIGEFSLFVYLMAMVTDAAFFVGLFLARIKQAGVSADRMVALMRGATWNDLAEDRDLFAPPAPHIRPGAPEASTPDLDGTPLLSVRGLSYRYPSSGAGIEDVDLDIEAGRFVVVTGRIGSGKTTLLRSVLGLLPAEAGTVSWKGAHVDDPASFMKPPRTAYTPQVPRLFSLTLAENLTLGVDANDDEIAAALHTVALEHDLEGMHDGLDTMVGPRGVRLSGGQIQRSAAARMLVRRPELLVFDDLSSALDVETEQTLWDRLFVDNAGATALVVSHRRPALRRADLIVVMRDGAIEATGTVDDLLETCEEFRRLWSRETNGK